MNTLFLAALVAESVVPIGFIGLPVQLLGPLGVTLDPPAVPIARLFGSAVLTFPVLLSYARASADAALRQVGSAPCSCTSSSAPCSSWSRSSAA